MERDKKIMKKNKNWKNAELVPDLQLTFSGVKMNSKVLDIC